MENNSQQTNNNQDSLSNSPQTGSGNNPQGSIGSAGSEGTQAFNNGNEGNTTNRGSEESGAFADENAGGYEGGNLGTAGSGSMEINATASSTENENAGVGSSHENTGSADKQIVPVPIVKDSYEGGNMGTAGSGGMDVHGSPSSLSVNALTDHQSGGGSTENTGSRNPHGLGSPPPPDIADGGHGGGKQPKEHTGKDTEMGGFTGGTAGLGNGNNAEGLEGEGVGNKDGSGSAAGGGGSSAGSQG